MSQNSYFIDGRYGHKGEEVLIADIDGNERIIVVKLGHNGNREVSRTLLIAGNIGEGMN